MERTQLNLGFRTCERCGESYLGVKDGLCLKCLKNEKYYYKTRKKGEPKKFIEYQKLLEMWRARRSECISWRKEAIKAYEEKCKREKAEAKSEVLEVALAAYKADIDVLEKLGYEIAELKKKNSQLNSQLNSFMRRGVYNNYSSTFTTTIPQEQWRRLVQLAHPDKHNNSVASNEALKWLLQNKP